MQEKNTQLWERAATVWGSLTDNEKRGVRFGLFPAGPMSDAVTAGFDGRQLASALMSIEAALNGGMRR